MKVRAALLVLCVVADGKDVDVLALGDDVKRELFEELPVPDELDPERIREENAEKQYEEEFEEDINALKLGFNQEAFSKYDKEHMARDITYWIDPYQNQYVSRPVIEFGVWHQLATAFDRVKATFTKYVMEFGDAAPNDRRIALRMAAALEGRCDELEEDDIENKLGRLMIWGMLQVHPIRYLFRTIQNDIFAYVNRRVKPDFRAPSFHWERLRKRYQTAEKLGIETARKTGWGSEDAATRVLRVMRRLDSFDPFGEFASLYKVYQPKAKRIGERPQWSENEELHNKLIYKIACCMATSANP